MSLVQSVTDLSACTVVEDAAQPRLGCVCDRAAVRRPSCHHLLGWTTHPGKPPLRSNVPVAQEIANARALGTGSGSGLGSRAPSIACSRPDLGNGGPLAGCFVSGASQILGGNPADSTLTTEMMRRHVEHFGKAPEQAAFDGAFGSKENLRQLKEEIGIRDVAFSKARWASVSDMVKDSWTYKRLRDFRAGVEAVISFLKRAFGLSRCRRRGRRAFDAHVRSSIVAANLLILARHALR